jgi:hypothetical protein
MRIGRTLQRPDHRTDPTPLHQPSPRSRLPDGAGTTEDVRQLRRAAHSDLIAERAELDGANAFRDRLLHSEILRAASKPHKPEANALP